MKLFDDIQPRSGYLHVRVRPDELTAIKDAARRREMSVGRFVRSALAHEFSDPDCNEVSADAA